MITKTKTTWRKVKLGEIADFAKGKKPQRLTNKKLSENFKEYILLGDEKFYTEPDRFLVDAMPSDILIVADGARSGAVLAGKGGVLGSTLLRIRIKNEAQNKVDSRFLYFGLKHFERVFQSVLTGSAIPHIDQKNLRDFELLIPEDPVDQKHIANILSAFDEKIELNNKINQTLEQMAQAIFKEWFVSPSIALAEEDKLPKGWRVGKLGELMVARKEKFRKYEEWKNLKLLDLGRFPQKSLAITSYGKGEEIKTAGIGFKKGDVLFGAVRPYFHKVVIAPFDGVTNSSVFVITPKKESSYAFLVTVLFSENTVNYASMSASGTKMPVIKWEDLCDMEVLIPEERAIENFNKTVKNFYNLIIKNTLENQKLASLRDLLLPKLMSGEIRV